ncbi:MAG: DUF2442 domain-containing protein [Pirellulaceae bacterium]
MLWVREAKHVGGYRLWLSFSDGTSGEVDLSGRLHGDVFEPLRELDLFSQVRFVPDMDTVVWPNGANLAPEYLRDAMIEQGGCICRQEPLPAASASDDEILHVTAAEYLGDYRVWLEFSDGTSGEADLSPTLRGPMFEPLKDKALFGQVVFDPEADTIVWPNGADLAPEYLRSLVNVSASAAR